MITSAQRLGKAQDHLLTLIDGHMLHPLAARAFEEMKEAASRDGITLAIASGFRSFDRQCWRLRSVRPGEPRRHLSRRASTLDEPKASRSSPMNPGRVIWKHFTPRETDC